MDSGFLKKIITKLRSRRGASAIMIGLILVLMVILVAFGVDVGMMMVTKSQLQNIADASTLAAARELGDQYCQYCSCDAEDPPQGCDIRDHTPDLAAIVAVAQEVAQNNWALGKSQVQVLPGDVVLGKFDHTAPKKIDSSGCGPGVGSCDAVRTIVRMDGSANGPMATVFAKIMGIDSVDVGADATAALSGPSTWEPGEIDLPIGISEIFLGGDACDETIKFHPADSCAGWTSFEDRHTNTNNMRKIMEGLDDGSIESPGVTVGETEFNFIGGVSASLIDNDNHFDFTDLFDNNKDPVTGTWEVYIPVYAESGETCGNPNQSIPIVGMVAAEVYLVEAAPDKEILAKIDCGHIIPARGGGFSSDAVLGLVPSLVE